MSDTLRDVPDPTVPVTTGVNADVSEYAQPAPAPHDVRGHFPYDRYPHPDDHTHAQPAPALDVRQAFADAFMRHPTGRMNDAEVMAVLDATEEPATPFGRRPFQPAAPPSGDLRAAAQPAPALDVERLAEVFRHKGWMIVDRQKMHDRYGLPLETEGWAHPIAQAIANEYAASQPVTEECKPRAHRYNRIGETDMLRCYRCGHERPG